MFLHRKKILEVTFYVSMMMLSSSFVSSLHAQSHNQFPAPQKQKTEAVQEDEIILQHLNPSTPKKAPLKITPEVTERKNIAPVTQEQKKTPPHSAPSSATKSDSITLIEEDNTKALEIEKELLKENIPMVAIIGTGRFFKASTIGDRTVPGRQLDKVYLHLEAVDTQSAIRMILTDILNLEYISDPDLKGTLTFKSKHPFPRDKLLGEFQNILADHQISLFQANSRIYIMSKERRNSDDVPRIHGTQEIGENAVLPINVQYVSAQQLVSIIQPILVNGANIKADSARNMILASGKPQDILNVHELIKVFDVDWLAGMSFALFPLGVSDPGTVIAELYSIIAADEKPLQDVIKFVPLERLNSILVISKNAKYFDRVAQWIKRLDRGQRANGHNLHVYYLTNSKATNIAKVLQEIFGFDLSQSSGSDSNLSSSQYKTNHAKSQSKMNETTRDNNGDRDSSDFNDPSAQENHRDKLLKKQSNQDFASVTTSGIRIVADEENNALIIKATSADYKMIEAAIKRIDLPPIQVMIEATIAEVSLNNNLNYGLAAFFDKGNWAGNFNAGSRNKDGVDPFISKGFKFIFKNSDISGTLNALKELTDVKVLSSPYAMVHNNKVADLRVGKQVPVMTQSSTSNASADAPTITSIEFRQTGVQLTVTPRVNADGKITMDINQEISSESNNSGNNNNPLTPAFNDQRLNTIVTVSTGQTVALGGLITNEEGETRGGIPILMDIPLLGRLFSSNTISTDRKELLVLVTPTIIRNDDEALAATSEIKERLVNIDKIDFQGHKLHSIAASQESKDKLAQEMRELKKSHFNNEENSPQISQEYFSQDDLRQISAYDQASEQEQTMSMYQPTSSGSNSKQVQSQLPQASQAPTTPQSILPFSRGQRAAPMSNFQGHQAQSASIPTKKILIRRFQDKDLAEEEWSRLKRKFSDQLDFTQIQIHSDSQNASQFTLESEDMDPNTAQLFCNTMREKGEECNVSASGTSALPR